MDKSEHKAAVKSFKALDEARCLLDSAVFFVDPDCDLVWMDSNKAKLALKQVRKAMTELENYI